MPIQVSWQGDLSADQAFYSSHFHLSMEPKGFVVKGFDAEEYRAAYKPRGIGGISKRRGNEAP